MLISIKNNLVFENRAEQVVKLDILLIKYVRKDSRLLRERERESEWGLHKARFLSHRISMYYPKCRRKP